MTEEEKVSSISLGQNLEIDLRTIKELWQAFADPCAGRLLGPMSVREGGEETGQKRKYTE